MSTKRYRKKIPRLIGKQYHNEKLYTELAINNTYFTKFKKTLSTDQKQKKPIAKKFNAQNLHRMERSSKRSHPKKHPSQEIHQPMETQTHYFNETAPAEASIDRNKNNVVCCRPSQEESSANDNEIADRNVNKLRDSGIERQLSWDQVESHLFNKPTSLHGDVFPVSESSNFHSDNSSVPIMVELQPKNGFPPNSKLYLTNPNQKQLRRLLASEKSESNYEGQQINSELVPTTSISNALQQQLSSRHKEDSFEACKTGKNVTDMIPESSNNRTQERKGITVETSEKEKGVMDIIIVTYCSLSGAKSKTTDVLTTTTLPPSQLVKRHSNQIDFTITSTHPSIKRPRTSTGTNHTSYSVGKSDPLKNVVGDAVMKSWSYMIPLTFTPTSSTQPNCNHSNSDVSASIKTTTKDPVMHCPSLCDICFLSETVGCSHSNDWKENRSSTKQLYHHGHSIDRRNSFNTSLFEDTRKQENSSISSCYNNSTSTINHESEDDDDEDSDCGYVVSEDVDSDDDDIILPRSC